MQYPSFVAGEDAEPEPDPDELAQLFEQAPAQVDPNEDPVAMVFGREGLLKQKFAGYEPRMGQVALAYAVDQAMRSGGTLLAEAPTGTGKSLAYGVPASWHAARQGKRVVIVTANIALQEQLVGKDLPMLQSILPWNFSYALAKGINNYLCLDRFDDTKGELVNQFEDPTEFNRWKEVQVWAAVTQTGDLNELPFEVKAGQLRSAFTTSTDDCTGKACASFDICHGMRARQLVREAQVVVTNYHLFFADLVLRRANEGGRGVLPAYDFVVMDEGHKAADIARDFIGFRLTRHGAAWCVRLLNAKNNPRSKKAPIPPIAPELRQDVIDAADQFFRDLAEYSKSDDYVVRIRDRYCVRSGSRLVALLGDAGKALAQASASLPLPADRRTELMTGAARCGVFAVSVQAAMDLKDDGDVVYFIEEQSGRAALCSKPIDVSGWLRHELFKHETVKAAVVTSATLTVDGKFDHVAEELGAEDCEGVVGESPFDWTKQALVVIPTSFEGQRFLPPDKKGHGEQSARVFVEVVRQARGRTLGLFTSYRQLELAHRRLIDAGLPYAVFRQGEAPRMQLIERFKADVTSVLLGTESFWQGVDIPGEALSCLVIDRIPFETPDDPIVDAVNSRDRRAFQRWMVPRAVIDFRQGSGRLIRTKSDRGVLVVLDRRLLDKGYGRRFTRSLPEGLRISRDLSSVGEFLDADVHAG